jgi:hypothetical protein
MYLLQQVVRANTDAVYGLTSTSLTYAHVSQLCPSSTVSAEVQRLLVLVSFCLDSRRWFMLCLVYVTYPVLVLGSGDRDWLYRLDTAERAFTSGRRQSPVYETLATITTGRV